MKDKLEVEIEAIRFREEHGLGISEPIKIKNLLVNLEVQTFFKPLSNSYSGMSLKVEDLKYMLINSSQSIGRQNFTIFHELFHLFKQDDFESMICVTGKFDKKDPIEFIADWFAAFVLLPREGILNRIPKGELVKNKITLRTIIDIEHYFGCSRSALLIRLSELNLIDYKKYEQYKENVKLSAIQYGYDISLYESGRHNKFVSNYGSIAKELFDKEIISESNYIGLMRDIGTYIEVGVDENENAS